jgi:Type II secretion system (T2SS), protein E, N-terminal domain/PilZ domain
MEQSNRLSVLSTSGHFASFPGGTARLRDLSLGGAMLEERDPLPVGSRIPLTLHLGRVAVSCTCLVTQSIWDEGMAVEFVDISAADRRRLLEFITAAVDAKTPLRADATPDTAAPTDAIVPAASGSTPATKPPAPLPRIGELLVRRGAITADQLAAATAEHRQHGERFCAVLLRLGVVSDDDLAACFNEEYRIPLIDVTMVEPTPEALGLVPYELARRHEILPIGAARSTLTIATSDPSNLDGQKEVRFHSGLDLTVAVTPSRMLREAIHYFYRERVRDAG